VEDWSKLLPKVAELDITAMTAYCFFNGCTNANGRSIGSPGGRKIRSSR
jgi:hypothetical protein